MVFVERLKPKVLGLPDYVPGEFREGFIKLASNENNYGPSPKVVEAVREWASKTHLYPYRDFELRERLAEYVKVKPENIVIGNGSDELIDMAVKVFRGPVAGSYPSFAEYPIAAGAVGEDYVYVSLEEDFTFDGGRFLAEAGGCGLAFLCSPNNPTGVSIPDSELKTVLESGVTVVLDEAYFEFSGQTRVGWIGRYPNLVVLRTMSKAFALAGLRVGYAVADAEAAEAMLKVKIPFSVSSVAEAAALAALDDLPYSRRCVERILRDRLRIYSALSGRFRAYPSDGNFVFADVSPMSADGFFEGMIGRGIIVRKFGRLRGYSGEYVRVSVGTSDETSEFINAVSSL